MNNELQIFTNEQFGEVRSIEKDSQPFADELGVVYFIEINDKVKIGSSHNPVARLGALISNAEKYFNAKIGRIAVSRPHSGYRIAEHNMHKYFEDCRIEGTELFDVDFSVVTACFKSKKEITLQRHSDSRSCHAIRHAIEKVNKTSLVEYALNGIKHTLNSPLCYWCIINVPEIGEESCFYSYWEVEIFLELLGEQCDIYKDFTENIKTSETIREHLVSHMEDLLLYFSVNVQVDAVDEDGEEGVRLMHAGKFNEEQQRIIDDIVMNFIPIVESNATA